MCLCAWAFFFSHMDIQLLQSHLLKRPLFLHVIAFGLLQKLSDRIAVALFLDPLFFRGTVSILCSHAVSITIALY